MTNDTAAGGHTATTNSTTDQPTLAVTQADEDATNALDHALGFLTDRERPIVVQAFARHRTNSEPRPAGDLREVAVKAEDAMREMFRYFDGGETRGSYDGKPERSGLRKAWYALRSALATHSPAPMAGEGGNHG